MSNLTNNGEWFLPGSNLKIPGRLYLADEKNKIVLETFSDRYLSNETIIKIDPERDQSSKTIDGSNHDQRTG